MYRSAKYDQTRSMVLLIMAIALAVALPFAAGAESSVELRGQVRSTVRVTVSKSQIDWNTLEPGANELPSAFTVNASANIGFHLNIQGSSSHMVNGASTLINPVQYRIDNGISYADLTENPVRIGTHSGQGPIDVEHTIHLKQVIEYADPPITIPSEHYSTTILFTAEQIIP